MATQVVPTTPAPPAAPAVGGGAVVRAEQLTKRFGDVLAVDDLSFARERGPVTGVLGPNRAGKTTILRMLHHQGKPTPRGARGVGRRC